MLVNESYELMLYTLFTNSLVFRHFYTVFLPVNDLRLTSHLLKDYVMLWQWFVNSSHTHWTCIQSKYIWFIPTKQAI